VRRHVAGAAGVAVVAPRAADVVGLLQDDEVLDPGLAQANGHPQPGEAAADDGHLHVLLNIVH
jgi:hypothetical protein